MYKKFKIILIFIIILILGFIFYINRINIKEYFLNSKTIDLPQEQSLGEVSSSSSADLIQYDKSLNDNLEMIQESSLHDDIDNKNSNQTSANPRADIIKSEVNLKVPFIIQSPDQKWQSPYKEACEEASVLMAYSYLKNKAISVESAFMDIDKMLDWEIKNLGGHFDISVSTTAQMANIIYGVNTDIFEIKSIIDLKKYLSDGYPVIIPALGRELKNPNFKNPGPLYHMLVIKGYTKNGFFISNDPGTRKGKDYLYDENILFNAIGDWDYNIDNPNSRHKFGIILK